MKLNKLFSATALLAAVFMMASCKEEIKYVNDIEQQPRVADGTLSDHSVMAKYAPIVLDGNSLYSEWKDGDAFALFNMNLGKEYHFVTNTPGANSTFMSSALLMPGDVCVSFYPYREGLAIDEMYTISLPYRIEQAGATPNDLSTGNYMFAHGIVNSDSGLDLEFKRLVSLIDIKVNNVSPKASFVLDSLVISSSKAIFPESVTFDKEGDIASFSDNKVDNIIVDLKGQTLDKDAMVHIAMNILPTTNGRMSTISGDEEISVVLKSKLRSEDYDITIYKGKISGLPLSGFAESNNNIFVNRSYSLTYDALYEDVPAEGFRIGESNGEKTVTIYNAKGLKGWADALNDASADDALKSATVVFTDDIDNNTIDMSGVEWMPIKEFNGTLDAKGLNIINLDIKKDGDAAAFILKSKASISNLTITSPIVERASNVAVFVSELSGGKLENCKVDGAAISGTDGFIGGLAGHVKGGIVKDCMVVGAVTVAAQESTQGVGGLISKVTDGVVEGCHVDRSVVVETQSLKNTAIGGLIGAYGSKSSPVACYSLATVHVHAGAGHIGGLIGQLVDHGKNITGCYAAGTIRLETPVNGSSVGGLVGSRWAGKVWEMYKGVYSTTVLEVGSGNTVGAVQGKALGKGEQTAVSTFYTQDTDAVGSGNVNTLTKVTIAELKTKVSELNEHLKGTGYKFTTQGGDDLEPLKIVKE